MKRKLLLSKKYGFYLFVFVFLLIFTTNVNATDYYSKSTGNLNATANWGTNTDGTGTPPGNFTTAGNIFYIRNNATPTINASWTVSGTGSKIVVGDGTNTCNFTVGGALVLTATVDISANGTLTLSTTGALTGITFGTLATGSTVNYAEPGAQAGIVANYSNLTLSGSGAKTFATTPTVNAVFSLEGSATVVVTTGVVTYGTNATLQYNKPAAYTATLEEWITPFAATGGVVISGTGIITANGNKVFNTSIPLTINPGATLNPGTRSFSLGGDFINNGTISNGTGAFTITGNVDQNIGAFTTTNTVSMTKTGGTATLTGNVNGGAFTINGSDGTLNLGDGLIHTFSGTWTRTNGTLIGGSSRLRIGGSVSGTGGTFTAGTGTVEYYGAAQTAAVVTYNNLTISGTGLKTFATTPTVTGILSMEQTGTVTVTGTGVVTYGANATLQYNKPAAYTATTEEWPATFSGTGGVKIINTGVITFGGAKAIANNLSIASGSGVNLGTFTSHTVGSLTLGGIPQLCGTWGGTGSGATYINPTYFAATTGYITVGSVPAAPTGVTPSSEVAICSGTSVNLNATSVGNTINWYTVASGGASIGSSASGANFPVSPTGSTIYYAETQTAGGCVSATRTATALITVSTPVPDYDATITNTTCPASTDGAIVINKIPTAISFANSDNDNVSCGSNFLTNRNAFTLEGWIKVNKSTIGSRIGLFGQNDAIEFGFISNTQIECYTVGGGSLQVPLSLYPGDNDWHHIAAVGNGTNIIIYIDGVQAGIGGTATSNYGASTDIVKIGSSVFDPVATTTGGFTGQMLKVGFWSTALSQAQINNLASEFSEYSGSESGLLAGYNFYDGTGTILSSLPAGSNGTFVNSPVWTEPFAYAWTKTGDIGYSASTKNISTLTTGEYNLTVTKGSCSRTKSFMVNSTLPVFTAGLILTTGETICEGGDPGVIGNSTLSSGGDNSITYEWRANGTPIASSNASSYDPPSGLTTTTTYTRWAKDGTCNTSFTQSTGSWVVTVRPVFTAGSILTTGETICEGGDPGVIGNSTLSSGGDNSITYEWRANGTPIVSSNAAAYDPPAGLTTNTTYTRWAKDGTCNTTFTQSSGSWVVTVNPLPSAPITTDAQICIGSTAILSASNATSGQVYKWYNAAIGGTLLKISTSNTDDSYTTPVLAATTNYWVSIQNAEGCESSRTQVTATFPAVSTYDQTIAGNDSWIGHVYDGTAFDTYYGTYNEPETFLQVFASNTYCFGINSNLDNRSIYTETFTVRFRMTTSLSGCYLVNLRADDGIRLFVDGTKIFERWVNQAPTNYNNVLLPLTTNAQLVYEYYENGGQNEVAFRNLYKIENNVLTGGTNQAFCAGSSAVQISSANLTANNVALPTGITTTWQWYYSNSPTNTGTIISGATSQNYTPSGSPFNTPGTYYVYRVATVSSSNAANENNWGATSPVSCSFESDRATIVVNPLPTAAVSTINSSICAEEDAVFNLTGTNNAIVTYKINGGADLTITLSGAGSANVTISNATSNQTLTLVSVNDGTCSEIITGTKTVTVHPLPTIGSFN